jgi:hypothetical protein
MSRSLAPIVRQLTRGVGRHLPHRCSRQRALCDKVTARVLPQPKPAGMPDVKSVDIGQVPDPHTKDPLKWKKFAWKYIGALIVFGASYKGLHWYVDSLSKEGKRRREEMEVSKTAVFETTEDRKRHREADARKAAAMLEHVKNPVGTVAAGRTDSADADGVDMLSSGGGDTCITPGVSSAIAEEKVDSQKDVVFQVFKPIEEKEGFVSQEDELMLLEAELEARLKKLRALKYRTRETDEEKRQIKAEMLDVQTELALFATRKERVS